MGVEPILWTEAEAAANLRVCTKTLRGFRRRGLIRYVALGRKILYRPEDCAAFTAASCRVEEPAIHAPPRPRRRPSGRKAGNVVSFTERRKARLGGSL